MSTNDAGVMGTRGRIQIGLVDLFDGSKKRNLDFMAEFARTAEALGFDGIWMPEHVLFFDEYESVYPYPEAPIAANPDVKEQHNKVVDGKAQVESAPEGCSTCSRARPRSVRPPPGCVSEVRCSCFRCVTHIS